MVLAARLGVARRSAGEGRRPEDGGAAGATIIAYSSDVAILRQGVQAATRRLRGAG